MEAGMGGMRCWILLVYVIVVPVEGTVSFWDHQTPGWNYLWGSNGGHTFVHLEHLAATRERWKRGHARQVDSGDTCTISDILRCIFVYVRPNFDLGAISQSRVHHHGSCGSRRSTLSQREIVIRSHEIKGGTEISTRPHRRRNMLYCDSDAPSNVANRPGGRPERSDTCDPSTAIFIHLRVALSARCHDQLHPDYQRRQGMGRDLYRLR